MGAGFPKPRAMRPSTFGLPLSSSRLMSGVLAVLSGSLNAPCKVNWESLPTVTKRSTRIWPLMLLPIGAAIDGKGQNRRHARSEDIQLQTRGEPPIDR